MTTGNNDIEAITADPTEFELASGLKVKVQRMKTRALMSLLKILTRGAGDLIQTMRMEDEEQFRGQLIAAVIFSIPEAEDETIEFIIRMVKPAQLREEGVITKGDKEWNKDLLEQFYQEMADPELEDLIQIVTGIVTNEAPHILALGKQLRALLPTVQAMVARDEKTTTDSETLESSSAKSSKASTQADS